MKIDVKKLFLRTIVKQKSKVQSNKKIHKRQNEKLKEKEES